MSPFLEDGIGWNGMKCLSHQVTSQTKQCRKWPCGFCGPSLALPWLRHQGSSNSQKGVQSRSVCASQEGIQGRPGGGNQRQEGSGKKKKNNNKACFKRYSLAALSCYSENSVLSPLEKWPQLSLVRQGEHCSVQHKMVRNLFPKNTEFWRTLLAFKSLSFKQETAIRRPSSLSARPINANCSLYKS